MDQIWQFNSTPYIVYCFIYESNVCFVLSIIIPKNGVSINDIPGWDLFFHRRWILFLIQIKTFHLLYLINDTRSLLWSLCYCEFRCDRILWCYWRLQSFCLDRSSYHYTALKNVDNEIHWGAELYENLFTVRFKESPALVTTECQTYVPAQLFSALKPAVWPPHCEEAHLMLKMSCNHNVQCKRV